MSRKARTPIAEYDDCFAIELPGSRPPQERDRLTDQAMVVAYDRLPRRQAAWRLRALEFDCAEWTVSGIRRWWAAHEVRFLAGDQMEELVPEVCRAYASPDPALPTILLCHRNTSLGPARRQLETLRGNLDRSPEHRR